MNTTLIKYEATITDEAAALFVKLTEIAELVHHTNVNRTEIIERLAALDRRTINTCHEQLLTMRTPSKIITDGSKSE